MTAYVSFRVVIALLLGAVWYCLDRRLGVRPYRWWYGMTHEHPLAQGEQRGFVYNRETKARAFAATLLSTLVSFLAVRYAASNPLAELILWAVTIPGIVGGFLLGPSLYRIWQRRDNVFEVVDKIESGQIDLSDEMKSRSVSLWRRLGGLVGVGRAKSAARPQSASVSSAPTPGGPGDAAPQPLAAPEAQPQSAPPAEPDPRELMEKYIRERSGNSDN